MIRCGKRLQRHRRHHQINHIILVMLCGNRYAFQMKTYQKYFIFITKYLRLMRQKKMMLKDKQSEKEINNLSVRFERISWALSIASLMCSKNSFCVIVFFSFQTSVSELQFKQISIWNLLCNGHKQWRKQITAFWRFVARFRKSYAEDLKFHCFH